MTLMRLLHSFRRVTVAAKSQRRHVTRRAAVAVTSQLQSQSHRSNFDDFQHPPSPTCTHSDVRSIYQAIELSIRVLWLKRPLPLLLDLIYHELIILHRRYVPCFGFSMISYSFVNFPAIFIHIWTFLSSSLYLQPLYILFPFHFWF